MSSQECEFKFTVLVVDDNVTCLNIISSMLKRWKYEVFSINCPIKALAITRARDIDLILSDLYMPKMNGLELQKQVEAETKLPVIIMSSDNNEKIILKSLSSGAMFFIAKPVNLLDLKNIWQYAVTSKRDRSMRYIEKIKSIQAAGSLAIGGTSDNGENNSAPFVNEIRSTENKKDSKRKSQKKNKEKVEGEKSTCPKKPKVNWNHALHNLFMQAIRHITLEKAVPRNILEYMNVPGLTRENVASHLQKYRIFLKKVGEKGLLATTKNSMTLDRTLRSCFAAGHSPMMLMNNSQETYSPFKGLENQTSTFHSSNPTNFDPIRGLSSNNSRLASSSSSSYGFGQSRLLGANTQANVHKPFLSNINPLHQSNRTGGFRLGSNEIGTNMLSGGGAMPMNDTKSMQIPDNLYNNMSSTPCFKTSGIWSPSCGATGNNDIESTRTENFSFSNSNSNENCCNTNNSGRVQVNNDGNVIARLNGVDDLSGASDFGLINNEAHENRSLGVEAVGDSTSGTSLAPTSFSSANFVQGSTSTLPSVAQQQFSVDDNELNDVVSFLMNDNNNTASGFSEPQQFKEFADMLTEENNNSQFRYHQQQGGERVENPNLTSNSSLPSQTNQLPTSQPQDHFQFPTPLNIQENHHWNEPSLEQLLEIQELLNSDIEDKSGNSSDE